MPNKPEWMLTDKEMDKALFFAEDDCEDCKNGVAKDQAKKLLDYLIATCYEVQLNDLVGIDVIFLKQMLHDLEVKKW